MFFFVSFSHFKNYIFSQMGEVSTTKFTGYITGVMVFFEIFVTTHHSTCKNAKTLSSVQALDFLMCAKKVAPSMNNEKFISMLYNIFCLLVVVR